MAEEVVTAGGAGSGGGAASTPASTSSPSMTPEQIAAPGGDTAFLNQPDVPETPAADAAPPAADAADGKDKDANAPPEEINLAALEEGQPEWLAKVTDPAVKTEVEKLLEANKKFSEHFKDAADLDAFFKDLPGGREQVAALQTLATEVGELDSALEANTPEGLATVAERYLAMTPDGGANLLRAAAQHMAKASPESWNQLSSELVNSTLKAAGIGADIQGVVGAIAEMRAAVAADDGDAFGKAAAKLLGAPQSQPKPDENLARLSEREQAAKTEAHNARTETWQFRSEKSGDKITNHLATETGKLLARVLPASISESDRASLRSQIGAEVMSQLVADPWLSSQVKQLIGWSAKGDYKNANIQASQADFDKATELVVSHATTQMIVKAISKIVDPWARSRAAGNVEARNKAKGAATRTDVGAAPPAASNGRKPMNAEQLRARNADGSFVLSDRDILNLQ